MVDLADEAAKACGRMLGETPLYVEHPGGPARRSFRIVLKDRHVIATRRKHAQRAQLEATVLQALNAHAAPAPRVLAFDREWLVQEDLGTIRLSQTLAAATDTEGEALLASALAGLADIQKAGTLSKLEDSTITIGHRHDWLLKLATMPERTGDQLQHKSPALKTDKIVAQLYPKRPSFIKWDARPANAIVRSDTSVAWFDWEHCGRRNPVDDVVWLLCDEYTPHRPDIEVRLIERFLPYFQNGSSLDEANDYLMTYGALHSCVRLSLILTEKSDGRWWNAQQCLDQDNAGVTYEMSSRLCRRAAQWAAKSSLTYELVDWFENIENHLPMIDT